MGHKSFRANGRATIAAAAIEALERRSLLCADISQYLDSTEPVSGASQPVAAPGVTVPLSSAPALASRAGATDKLYLDFTGAAAMHWGGYNVPTTPAYDVDGEATTFSSQELANINQIWSAVAEKYSPFNIDVTTIDPDPVNHSNYPTNVDERIVIGGDNSWYGSAGGVSYTHSFVIPFLPSTSWVFPSALSFDNVLVADATAHEAGHDFSLYHQSTYDGTTLVNEYNPGDALTAPIMGISYNSARAMWWHGPNIINSATIQDDLAIIAGSYNGFGYRAQDHGQSILTADALSISSGSASASGVIAQTTDTDTFSFTTTGGSVTLNVSVAQYGAMLHAMESIKDSSGNVIATANDASSLGQTIAANLSAGTYYLVVASYGQYGDVGQYTVSGSVPQNAAPVFSISGASTVNEQASYSLSLSASDPGHTVSSWVINWGDGNIQPVTGNPPSVTHTFSVGSKTCTISATATDDLNTYPASNTVDVVVVWQPMPGDANMDGTVNFADLVIVAQNYNKTVGTWDQGDFNHDGSVDFQDLVLLAQNYNNSNMPAANAVSSTAKTESLSPAQAASQVRSLTSHSRHLRKIRNS